MSTSGWISSSMPYLKPRDAGQPEAWAAEAAAKGRRGSQRIVPAGDVTARMPSDEERELLATAWGEPPYCT